MMLNPRESHLVPTLMLLATALLPVAPFATNGAYGDTEAATNNTFAASADFGPRLQVELGEFSLMQAEPMGGPEVLGEAVEDKQKTEVLPAEGQQEKPLEIKVSNEPLDVTEEEPVEVEVSDEPLEITEPTEEAVDNEAPEEEEVVEEPAPEPEPEPQDEQSPVEESSEPAPEPTPTE